MGSNARARKRNRFQSGILIGLVLLAGVALWRYLTAPPSGSLATVFFTNPDGTRSPDFELEIANTQPKRVKGLMFRKDLDPRGGMLFMYPEPRKQDFWMKDTYVSLDIIGIGEDRKVRGIAQRVPILSQGSVPVSDKGLYVVELLAGSTEKYGIRTGSEVHFKRELPKAE